LSTYGKIHSGVVNKHTKPKEIENALSISPFLVFDDNTQICSSKRYYDKNKGLQNRDRAPPQSLHILQNSVDKLRLNTSTQHFRKLPLDFTNRQQDI
jgi:hypothetical protein